MAPPPAAAASPHPRVIARTALHPSRLRTPGLGLEGKGVALGAKGLVLLPSLDRLVAWLSVYTREHSLEDLMPSLQIEMRAEHLTEDLLRSIDEVLAAFPGDAEVYLHIVKPDHSRLAMRSRRCKVAKDEAVVTGLKERVPGCRVRWGKGGA